ncbi:MAG TPA: DUF5652 family protein [Candidatus Paceibacterota bacterium]|nr:DUF5652 family protein [Candidatus Paceibacterota bacterium]
MSPLYQSNLIMFLILLWTIPWKLFGLWTAVKKNHKIWFVLMVVFNTVGILEIIYIFFIAKKKWPEVKNSFVRAITPKKAPKASKENKEETKKEEEVK